MLAGNYQKASKLLLKISNTTSITPLFRCIEIGAQSLRACSEYGNCEVWVEDTGITDPCLVNAAAFVGVIASLPAKSELVLTRVDNQIKWVCGEARGHWSLVDQDHLIPLIQHDKFEYTPPKEFAKALILAGSACQSTTVSIGLFGVVIEPIGQEVRMLSSNGISLACAKVPLGTYNAAQITLRPPVPSVLSMIIDLAVDLKIDITPEGIFALDTWMVAHLPLSNPLEHNLETTLNRFPDSNFPVALDTTAIQRFLARAKLLADKGQPVNVSFEVSGGRLIMEHHSLAASSEEYFLSEALDASWNFSSVSLPVDILLSSMGHVTHAVLDYVKDNILILTGSNPDFRHVIGGQAQPAKKKGKK